MKIWYMGKSQDKVKYEIFQHLKGKGNVVFKCPHIWFLEFYMLSLNAPISGF